MDDPQTWNASYSPPSIVAVAVALPLLALGAVCLRFYVRLRLHPTYIGIDDMLVFGAVILSMADGANLCVAAILGIQGRDYPGELPFGREYIEKKSDYAQVIIEKPMYLMMKLSVLYFYRRIFFIQKGFRIFNNLMIGLIIAWALAFMLAEIFVCGGEPQALWDPNAPPTTCVNQTWLNFAFAITDVIGDILVVSMPYPCLRKLHTTSREKLGIILIFLLGTLSTVASIVRLYFISVAFTQSFGSDGNTHASGTPPAVWSTVEGAVGVLAACLPPLGPLIRRLPNPHKYLSSLRSRLTNRSGRRTAGDMARNSMLDEKRTVVPKPSVERIDSAREIEQTRSNSNGRAEAPFGFV